MFEFGDVLYKKRIERNLPRKTIARRLGVSDTSIRQWENKQQIPNIYTCIDIADLFECSLDELVGREFLAKGDKK
jgi:DNA-binding XRE family transcriptional regulator